MSKVKITDKREVARSTVRGEDILNGQYFTGRANCVTSECRLFVRSVARLVALDRPDEWRSITGVTVYDYRPVDVEIVVTDQKE